MIALAVPAKLYQFRSSRLPLGTPVCYKGARGRVTGRTFSSENYDVTVEGKPTAQNVPLAELDVDMKELARAK